MVGRLETQNSVQKKKKCCLELEKMHSEILGTMESTQRQIFDPAVKRCNRLP